MRGLTIQLIIAISVWSLWLFSLGPSTALSIVADNITIALTMLLGSFVAGSTSVGGGAVAFPVFTKVLAIDSYTALLFSLAIQSVGMTAASVLIVLKKIPICLRVIRYSVVMGALGLFTSFFLLRLHIPSADIKYIFSCFSVIVATGLMWTQWQQDATLKEQQAHPIPLAIACFLGGMLSGIIGTGIDFIVFTLMIFIWQYDFKKAIATSVVVMAINAMVGFVAILIGTEDFQGSVVFYWLAAIPIVVVGAPLGALACRYIHRRVMLYFLLLLIATDIVSTLVIMGIKLPYLAGLALIFCGLLCYKKTITPRSHPPREKGPHA